MAANSSDISSLMDSVRKEVVMATYTAAMIAGTFLMLGNMGRNLHLGNPLSIPHLVLYAAFLCSYFLRHRIGARLLAPIFLTTLFLAATIGYFIYGFIGNSAPVYMGLCVVAASFYGPRGGLIATITCGAMMLVIALLVLSGRLVFSYDLAAFINSPFSWIAALATFGTMAGLTMTEVGLMHRNLVLLLRDQQKRIQDMAQTNARLESEVVARAKIETELRRQSALLENILSSLPQGISVYDRQLRLILWNDGLASVLDLPRELLAGMKSFDDLANFRARRGDYGPGDTERQIRDRREFILRFDGHTFERALPSGRTYLVAGKPFHLDGEIAGFITTYTDITERKRSEEELLRLHERISLALQTVGVGIFDWNAGTDQITADARVFDIFGVSGAGRNDAFNDWRNYLHPDDRNRAGREIIESLCGNATDVKLKYRIVRPDGKVRHLEVYNHIVRDLSSEALRMIGAALDVTERLEAEKRLLLAETAFDNSPVAIMITDRANRIVSVNTSFERITGHAAADACGKDPDFLASGLHDRTFVGRMWQSLHDTGSWEGEVWNRRKNGEIHPAWMSISSIRDRDHAEPSHYLSIFSDITERKQAEEHIHHLAHHDPLTTLPNRTTLEARLEQSFAEAHRNQRSVAVLFLDLDHFKTINDTLGHSVGDLLLIEVARRLRQTVRASDTVARLGGDEFVVVLSALETPEVATTIADGILDALSRPYSIEDRILHSTPSIGIAIYPQDGDDLVTVMKYADTAMYHAKEMGRACFKFFSPELNRAAMERLDTERQLRDALQLGQLIIHYQPRVDRAQNVTGVEALIRWNRPGHELQLPDRFIPIAEESELIVRIGEWVLATVARQLRDWLDAGMEPPAVAINLSARQLRLTNLPSKIAQVLRDNRLPPRLLEFELTESMAMGSPDHASRLLKELRAMGISVALDDFGTGYSSLAYLKYLTFSHIKIDRSFVAGITHGQHDLAIVRGTVALAHSVGLKVVAEGVETSEQLALLLETGCDEFQGFHFARPLPSVELEAFLGFQPSGTDRP